GDTMSVGDLASCYFPQSILAITNVKLSGQYISGTTSLNWQADGNNLAAFYELQRSKDGETFETISTVYPDNPIISMATYNFKDAVGGYEGDYYYRVRQTNKTGSLRMYSNVVRIIANHKITLINKPTPNPFKDQFSFAVQLKSSKSIETRVLDMGGRM